MPIVTYIEFDGTRHEVSAESGYSVMQAAINNGIPGIDATCGGACACATCHVYVDEAWLPRLDPPSEMESEMLEFAVDPAANSRLSCQIELSDLMDGLTVRLPETQS